MSKHTGSDGSSTAAPSLEKQFGEFRTQLEESGTLRERIRSDVSEIESTTRLMYASILLVHHSRPTPGLYCTCGRPYPDRDAEEQIEMIQCCLCEDWFHEEHLGLESSDEPVLNGAGSRIPEAWTFHASLTLLYQTLKSRVQFGSHNPSLMPSLDSNTTPNFTGWNSLAPRELSLLTAVIGIVKNTPPSIMNRWVPLLQEPLAEMTCSNIRHPSRMKNKRNEECLTCQIWLQVSHLISRLYLLIPSLF